MPLDSIQNASEHPAAGAADGIDLDALAERVVQLLLQNLRIERERLSGSSSRTGSDF